MKGEKLRSEFVIAVKGVVEKRSGAINENLATGAIEIRGQGTPVSFRVGNAPIPN